MVVAQLNELSTVIKQSTDVVLLGSSSILWIFMIGALPRVTQVCTIVKARLLLWSILTFFSFVLGAFLLLMVRSGFRSIC